MTSTANRPPPPPRDPGDKILDRRTLMERHGRPRRERLVFTNGCFDLLHRGHVTYLSAARRLGDLLVVGVNSDDSVRRLKGAGRPVMREHDRAYVLAALESVDVVTLFDEDTPRELVGALLPDVLVKGGDYRPEEIVGREEVESSGGVVRVISLVEGHSTSELLSDLKGGDAGAGEGTGKGRGR